MVNFVTAGHGCIPAAGSWDSRLFCDESPARSVQLQLGNVLCATVGKACATVMRSRGFHELSPGVVAFAWTPCMAVERDGASGTADTEYAANRSLESRWPGFRVRTLVYCSLYGLVDRRNDTSSRSLCAREDSELRVLHLGDDSVWV